MKPSERPEQRVRVDRVLELVAVMILAASALGVIATLGGHFFAPAIWALAAALTSIYGWKTRRRADALGEGARWAHLLLIVAVALVFRLPAYDYVTGGQDEGVYVNLAHHIHRTGGLTVRDRVLDALAGTPAAAPYVADNHRANYVPGVYLERPGDPRLEFQFYALFPIWMALFEAVFGAAHAVWALTLLALVSLVFFYRLALLLTGSAKAGLVGGLLLAVSPLHAFFSKFPVTEVPTLAFSAIAFTFLVAYWRRPEAERRAEWLWISGASLGALFFTRISGFMYAPLVAALAICALACDPDRSRRQNLQRWALGVLAVYALSVVYGLRWSRHYATDIYRFSFGKLSGAHPALGAAAIVLVGFAAWIGVWFAVRSGRGEAIRRWAVRPAQVIAGVLVPIALAIGIVKLYRLGWTSHYQGDPWLGQQGWHFSGSGWRAVQAASLSQLAVYAGPLLPLAFYALSPRRAAEPVLEALRIFVIAFFVYAAVLQWVLPYSPYYARYLLSELVPYLLLFLVGVWWQARSRLLRGTLVAFFAATFLYTGVASALQLGKSENVGTDAALAQLTSHTAPEDLLLLERFPGAGTWELKTPLVFTFGRNVATIERTRLDDADYLATLDRRFGALFLVSPNAQAPSGFRLEDTVPVPIWAFAWRHTLPTRLWLREDLKLYLFRRVDDRLKAMADPARKDR